MMVLVHKMRQGSDFISGLIWDKGNEDDYHTKLSELLGIDKALCKARFKRNDLKEWVDKKGYYPIYQ